MQRLILLTVIAALLGAWPVNARSEDPFQTPSADNVEKLVAALADPNLRLGASDALTRIGPPAVNPLLDALNDESVEVRIWAANTLGRLGEDARSAVEPLERLLESADAHERLVAARAVGRIGHTRAETIEALKHLLTDPDARVRRAAVQAVALGGESAVDPLVQALADPSLRGSIQNALEQIDAPAIPHLVTALDDDAIRLEAAEILRAISPEAAAEAGVAETTTADLDALRLSLHDPRKDVEFRAQAARKLGTLGRAGVEALVAAFVAPQVEVSRAAAAAFALVGPAGLEALEGALAHESPQVRATAADALAAMGNDARDAIPTLAKLLEEDPDREVRRRVAAALDQLGPLAAPAVPALSQVVLNERELEPTRQFALKALAQTGPEVREPVLETLRTAAADKKNYGVSQLAKTILQKLEESE